MYNTFNTAITAYNTERDSYNAELKKEKERLADFTKSIFEAKVKIPTRPCPPE
jgi:hypothetical protein